MEEGSSATDSVTDVTDVSPMEEGSPPLRTEKNNKEINSPELV